MSPTPHILILVTALIGSNAVGQIGVPKFEKPPAVTGPTLDETLAWISTKQTGPSYGSSSIQESLTFNGCNATSSLMPTDSVIKLSLTELDPLGIQLEPYYDEKAVLVVVPTLNRKKSVKRHFRYGNGTYGDEWKEHFIIVRPDAASAESMRNAFKHAIQLCNQKAAAEKAAEPPPPKELF